MNFLQSLLKYSTLNTNVAVNPDDTAEAHAKLSEMDPERKKWLEEALTNMSINPNDEMKKCMTCLKEETDQARRLEALGTLKDWCEDMNFAIDFHKMNGYEMIPTLLNEKDAEMRALTCELIGECAQNNEYCQETFTKERVLIRMLKTLENDPADNVKIKALFAISCIVRDYAPSQKNILDINGLDIVMDSLKSPIEKLQIKTCFFLSSICSNPEVKAQLTKKHLLEKLIEMYSQVESNTHEYALSAINVLIDENPEAINQAKNMTSFNLKQILKDRLDVINTDPQYQEEKLMATKIYEGLFQN